MNITKEERNNMIVDNMPLVYRIALTYKGLMPYDDMVQEGTVGLITAVDRYDPERGVKLATYAWYWIHRAIRTAIAKQGGPIAKNVTVELETRRLKEARNDFMRDTGREPTAEDLSELTGIKASRIPGLLGRQIQVISLDTKISDDDDDTIMDLIPAPAEGNNSEKMIKAVEYALEQLDPTDAEMLRDYFGLNGKKLGCHYWAEKLGCSAEHILDRRNAAIRKLRRPDIIDALKNILEGRDIHD